jgi:hypothetical protein
MPAFFPFSSFSSTGHWSPVTSFFPHPSSVTCDLAIHQDQADNETSRLLNHSVIEL